MAVERTVDRHISIWNDAVAGLNERFGTRRLELCGLEGGEECAEFAQANGLSTLFKE